MKLVVIGLSLGLTLDLPKPGHFSGLKTLILGMGLCSIQALTQLFEKGLENQSFNNSNVRGLSRLGLNFFFFEGPAQARPITKI